MYNWPYNPYNVNFYYIEKNYFYSKKRCRRINYYEIYNNQYYRKKNRYQKNSKNMYDKNETKEIYRMLYALNKGYITIFDLLNSYPNLNSEKLWTITANKYINDWNILSKVFVADFLFN